jgi:hypothetical protein
MPCKTEACLANPERFVSDAGFVHGVLLADAQVKESGVAGVQEGMPIFFIAWRRMNHHPKN